MKLSTKQGDEGFTELAGKKVPKDSLVIEVMGQLDECSALLVWCYTRTNDPFFKLENQNLTAAMSLLAGYDTGINWKEKAEELELLATTHFTGFAYPYENETLAIINYTRTRVRTAERRAVTLSAQNPEIRTLLPWLNRLSDALFVKTLCAKKENVK
ncbi:MAG: ATP:cob(I)alamin adenosyltransferase [Erysipelotrichaceae bacterium]|jgi:ATP:cob(I)alamin adenosyltransferase|nr:ATP:cob(I)alamin adenosyltransferase [Erysipelotrichaceae bacterium]